MAIYQDSSEMHEVYKKIHAMLNDEILRFDEEEAISSKASLLEVVG